jgi:hypothetical protein
VAIDELDRFGFVDRLEEAAEDGWAAVGVGVDRPTRSSLPRLYCAPRTSVKVKRTGRP